MCPPLKHDGSKPIDTSPERSLYNGVHAAANVTWCELDGKRPFWRRVDQLGAWHSHFAEFSLRFTREALGRAGLVHHHAALEAALVETMPAAVSASLLSKARAMRVVPYEAACNRSISLARRFVHAAAKPTAERVTDDEALQHAQCRRASQGHR